jgi:hypothetical protein
MTTAEKKSFGSDRFVGNSTALFGSNALAVIVGVVGFTVSYEEPANAFVPSAAVCASMAFDCAISWSVVRGMMKII